MDWQVRQITDLISPEALRALAIPSNLRLGEEIAGQGGVEITDFGPTHIIARARPEGGIRRRVELLSTEKGLTCRCTCSRKGLFCKHCVAAALVAGAKSHD